MMFNVKVKPNSKQQAIILEDDGSLTVRLQSPPVEGKANKELIQVLADRFGVRKSQISIRSGERSRTKRVEVDETS
ncbi:MAG: DUF167 domain-containing protein [Sodalinema sp.]|uniref:DUF167 domain-containing protein n=1 Tax=Sodalinema sp. TaxID=3080550 RepID=UPI001217A03D|nr:MAG: YggU family protein [Phormidium sp. SL48-SHIP]